MNRRLLIALPLSLAGWVVALGLRSPAVILVAAGGAAAVVAGVQRRENRWVVAGVALLLVGFVGGLVNRSGAPQVWPGLLFGACLFLILELSYDRITLFRAEVARETYRPRVRYFLQVAVSSVVLGLVVATLALNLAPRLPTQTVAGVFWVGGVSIVVLALAAAAMLRFWLRQGRDERDAAG